MASTGRQILGEHYNDEHLTHEEIRGAGPEGGDRKRRDGLERRVAG
jgi:hypothetical protein